MGLAGPSAILFGVMFGAIGASSNFFWEARMAGILGGNGFNCNWAIDPSGYVFDADTQERLSGVKATVYWIEPDGTETFFATAPDAENIEKRRTKTSGE